MIDDWGEDWLVDDPAELVPTLKAILADGGRSYDDKLEALTLLANLADEEAIGVLRWYVRRPDPGLELVAQLALIEAEGCLCETPTPWNDEVEEAISRILQAADDLYEVLGPQASHDTWCRELACTLRAAGLSVHRNARALLKYGGQVVEIVPIDLIVEGSILVNVWTEEDEMRFIEEAADEEYDALDIFFARLRTAHLPVGVHLDLAGPFATWEVVENPELNMGIPRVEHILAIPPQTDDERW